MGLGFDKKAQRQDIHLSHIHASPTFLNPAMTALINEDIRLIANYRSQWQNFTKGYQTFVASADGKAFQGLSKGDEFGDGIQLMADQAGDLKYQTFDVGNFVVPQCGQMSVDRAVLCPFA